MDGTAAVSATSRYRRGDFSTDNSHHGTPEERSAADVRGFEVAYRERRSFSDAIAIGVRAMAAGIGGWTRKARPSGALFDFAFFLLSLFCLR